MPILKHQVNPLQKEHYHRIKTPLQASQIPATIQKFDCRVEVKKLAKNDEIPSRERRDEGRVDLEVMNVGSVRVQAKNSAAKWKGKGIEKRAKKARLNGRFDPYGRSTKQVTDTSARARILLGNSIEVQVKSGDVMTGERKFNDMADESQLRDG